jgi:hypothetical protein
MAAQRLAHKLPPGAPKTSKIARIPTPQAVTLDGRVGRLREWTPRGPFAGRRRTNRRWDATPAAPADHYATD